MADDKATRDHGTVSVAKDLQIRRRLGSEVRSPCQPVSFTDPALAAGDPVRAIHWNELRGGVR